MEYGGPVDAGDRVVRRRVTCRSSSHPSVAEDVSQSEGSLRDACLDCSALLGLVWAAGRYCRRDAATARVYGYARDTLRRKGRPIPDNDVWIAAVALQHDLVSASRDSHFERVEGLRLDRR